MPFKSKEQERYLQINEPEIHRDWVEKYGHFKGAESLSLNPMEVPDTISRYYMVFVDNKKIGSYLTVEEAQEVAESKNGEVIEYIADLTDSEREYMANVNREFSQRQKTGEFFKDWWWKGESDRFSNADAPNLRYPTTFPEETDFFDKNILGEDDRQSKISAIGISDAYGISPQMARILVSSRVFGMYMSQRNNPATIKKYRQRILDAIDDYTPQSEKEVQMLKVLRPHMATRGVKGPSPSFWTSYRGWSYPKPELSYYYDDYYDYPVPFMGYDLDKDYLVEDYGAEEDEIVHCSFCSEIIGTEKEVYDEETVEWYNANGETICPPCYKEWMEEWKRDTDMHYTPFYAELKRDSCCCGATKSKPCACMIQGVMECNATCPCSLEKSAETFSAPYSRKKGEYYNRCHECDGDIMEDQYQIETTYTRHYCVDSKRGKSTCGMDEEWEDSEESYAESFSADNYYSRNYRGFEIDKEGDERQAFYYITKGNNRIEMELNKSAERRRMRGDKMNYASYFYGNYPGRAEKMFETLDESLNWFDEQIEGGRVFKDWNAESFSAEGTLIGEKCGIVGCDGNIIAFSLGGGQNAYNMVCDKCSNAVYEEWDAESFGAYRSSYKPKKLKRVRQNSAFPSGTSLQGYIKTNRTELRKAFGKPNMGASDDGKVKSSSWNLIIDGKVCTIYDRRERGKRGMKYFNIGGRDMFSPLLVAQELSKKRGEKVKAHETVPKWNEEKGFHERVNSIGEHPIITYDRAMRYYNNQSRYRAESFGSENCVSCDTPDGYWRGLPLCASSGEELCISCCACNLCRSKWNMLEVGEQKAESFEASERGNLYWCDECGKYMGCESYGNWPSKMIITETEQELCGACYKKTQNAESFHSYKVAPDLSSYTKAELVSSIAGPQGTAAYDEVVYDPIAQSRLSAETSTQRFKNYGNSLSGDTVCPACGDESWDEYLDGDEWRGYCGCGYDFDVGSALPNPLLTFYEMEALKEQGKLTSDQKEYLEWLITSTLSDLESSSHTKKYIQDELVAHGWTLDRWGNVQPPEESASTLVGNAESIDSFSPARLIILGASIGVALGLYKTRGE